MACPQCQSDEISPAGVCLICGYQVNPETTQENAEPLGDEGRGHSGPFEVDYSDGPGESTAKNDVPPWRQQLSQRLHEIKQKRESMAAVQPEKKPPITLASEAKSAESLLSLQERLKKVPVRKPQAAPTPPPRQKNLEPLPEAAPKPADPPSAQPPDSQEIRNIIDSAVLRQAPQSAGQAATAVQITPRELSARETDAVQDSEGKLILLSRTLAGLVDLIIVVLCTGVLVLAADYFSGIVALDYWSLLSFSLVFLLIFFLYSLFFLSTCSQTIGMMITDLRVTGTDETRPRIGQLLGRCGGFLLSIVFAGIGLLSGIFDRESACFHDRLSGTRIVRL